MSNVSILRSVSVAAWFKGAMATHAFYMQRNVFLVSSTLYECIKSCAHVQLVSGSTNLYSTRVQLASSPKNLFRPSPCMQLASDPINMSSKSRVTRMLMYILMICPSVTCEWHEKCVQKLMCHTLVNVKFKLSCTVMQYWVINKL